MEIGIEHHAILYASIAKAVLETLGPERGEEVIRRITMRYGRKRGRRMREHAEKMGYGSSLNAFFLCGEWQGKPGENEAVLRREKDCTVSEVRKCAWYGAWKKHGLLNEGSYYCRWIDHSLCEGFDGSFSLDVPLAIGLGDEICRFVWNEESSEVEKKTSFVVPFSFHCQELSETAKEVLFEEEADQAEGILKTAEQLYQLEV